MQDENPHAGNVRDGGIRAEKTQPEFRRVASDLDYEERLEMGVQKRLLERFKRDDDLLNRTHDY